jgi:hypothetical protein
MIAIPIERQAICRYFIILPWMACSRKENNGCLRKENTTKSYIRCNLTSLQYFDSPFIFPLALLTWQDSTCHAEREKRLWVRIFQTLPRAWVLPQSTNTPSGNGHFLAYIPHPITMVKSAQPGEGGGARPPPFTLSTITCKVVVYAPAERADALPLFLLYPCMYSGFLL